MDLRLAALIFSVPTHQYEIHPHLPWVLKRLEVEGAISVVTLSTPVAQLSRAEAMVMLRTASTSRLG